MDAAMFRRATIALVAAGLFLTPTALLAATNLNSSKSNCVKAGGTWTTEKSGKPVCKLTAPKDNAGLAVSDPGSPGDKPTKSKSK
jgi:hypothetical protein